MKSRPRIVIDARPLTHPQPGGFRSHVRALTQGLKEIGSDGFDADLIFYVDRPPTPEQLQLLPPAATYRVLSPNRLKTDFQLLPAQVRRDVPDLVHSTVNYLPPNLAARTTLTLHDAFGLRPDLRGKSLRQRLLETYWSLMSRASIRKATRLLTVSHHAAGELAAALRMPESAFTTVYNGIALTPDCRSLHPVGPGACPPPMNPNRRDNNISAGDKPPTLRKGGLLAFASPDSRKNSAALLVALTFWKGGNPPSLTLISPDSRTTQRETARQEIVFKSVNLRIMTRPDDEAVARLYAHAAAFVFPSRAEGFGLPPLEAMAFGCPVVSSSASAMPEILGDIPYYFDPQNVTELAARLREVLSCPEGMAERIARGKARAATFTCRRMAEETAAVWREALG